MSLHVVFFSALQEGNAQRKALIWLGKNISLQFYKSGTALAGSRPAGCLNEEVDRQVALGARPLGHFNRTPVRVNHRPPGRLSKRSRPAGRLTYPSLLILDGYSDHQLALAGSRPAGCFNVKGSQLSGRIRSPTIEFALIIDRQVV